MGWKVEEGVIDGDQKLRFVIWSFLEYPTSKKSNVPS